MYYCGVIVISSAILKNLKLQQNVESDLCAGFFDQYLNFNPAKTLEINTWQVISLNMQFLITFAFTWF